MDEHLSNDEYIKELLYNIHKDVLGACLSEAKRCSERCSDYDLREIVAKELVEIAKVITYPELYFKEQ